MIIYVLIAPLLYILFCLYATWSKFFGPTWRKDRPAENPPLWARIIAWLLSPMWYTIILLPKAKKWLQL
jgi:hypothetical protein